MGFVLSWLNLGFLPHPVNHTFLTLIPKTFNPEHVHQFRPISLSNVRYKLEPQFAFTKDRLISENILIAFETLH